MQKAEREHKLARNDHELKLIDEDVKMWDSNYKVVGHDKLPGDAEEIKFGTLSQSGLKDPYTSTSMDPKDCLLPRRFWHQKSMA